MTGKATYKEANAYAIRVGELKGKVYQDILSSDVLPDGRMYYNIGHRVIDPTLSENYELASDYAVTTQKQLNNQANLHIKAIKAAKNQSKIDGIVNRLSAELAFDKVRWILNDPVIRFTQSAVDDTIKENVEFQYKAGLHPEIVRTSSGECCEWCDDLAGIYDYPNVPKDAYRRHANCRCTVEYDPGDGRRTNVHTHKLSGSKEDVEGQRKIHERQQRNIKKAREKRKYDPGDGRTQNSATKKWKDAGRSDIINKRKEYAQIKEKKHKKDIKTKGFIRGSGKNYPIRFTGSDHIRFDDKTIKNVTIIAGEGVRNEIRDVNRIAATYNLPAKRIQKVSGITHIKFQGKRRKAEIHWYEVNGKRYEIKVKRLSDDES